MKGMIRMPQLGCNTPVDIVVALCLLCMEVTCMASNFE